MNFSPRFLFIPLAAIILHISSSAVFGHEEPNVRAARAYALADEANGYRLVRDHETGKKPANEAELAAARSILAQAAERRAQLERDIPEPPVLLTFNRDSTIDLPRVFDTANREFMLMRIARLKESIEGNEERLTIRLRQDLSAWEKALSQWKPTGKSLRGCQYVTIFEEVDRFIVAYYSGDVTDHFICVLNKKDYSPLPRSEALRRTAWNATQTTITID